MARAIPLVTLAPGMGELREIYQADFALIRPDQVVAWRGNEGAGDPATVLDTVCRRLAPGH